MTYTSTNSIRKKTYFKIKTSTVRLFIIALFMLVLFSFTMILSAFANSNERLPSSDPSLEAVNRTGVVDASSKSTVKPGKTVYISPGETLWSIAERYAPDHMDKRAYIHELKKLNQMKSSSITVGQKLVLP
ncbi:LysM peptidoglycan-binding domain-containing protein [Paenibacillus turpanensis]|uniref:LysM peptidoglycan-binding domain-containing protein n=1 Tax=Paenibacillus turpanensis TaxID=2689078 RepID=UPI001FB59C54|nr:LysM peptidoglycan-binding domain-containing protein [Paenibacillus turpanensis]